MYRLQLKIFDAKHHWEEMIFLVSRGGIFFYLLFLTPMSFAFQSHGRFTFGGFVAQEAFQDEQGQKKEAEVSTLSSRLFYEADHFWSSAENYSAILDLRDKHDFFEKLDKEKLALTDKNTLQLRTLVLKSRPQDSKLELALGRMAILSAGNTFTDGGLVVYRLDHRTQAGVFGGFNPHQIDRADLQFDQAARNMGVFHRYEIKYPDWSQRLHLDHAFVHEIYQSVTDRQYLYHKSDYQWATDNFISHQIYFDLAPEVKLQNAISHYQRTWGQEWLGGFTLLVLDTIEYKRQQDLLEDLHPSPYGELALDGRYKGHENLQPVMQLRAGRRQEDKLHRYDLVVGLDMPGFFHRDTDVLIRVSYKDDFTKKGFFMRGGFSFYHGDWEYDLNLQGGVEHSSNGAQLHPFLFDASLGYQHSKTIFSAFGFQLAQNENIDVYAAFFKFTYRFGDSEMPPARQGRVPKGLPL